MPDPQPEMDTIDPPPFLGSWRHVYLAVLSYLALLVGVLYATTRLFLY